MRFSVLLASFLLFLSSAVCAFAESSAKASFEAINACVKKDDTVACKDYFTANSMSLYTRFMSYGLMECLPKNAEYYSEEPKDKNILLRAAVTQNDKQRYMRLIFSEEEGKWKIDVPESLRISMGKNWGNQVNMTEQVYLLMKKRMGDQLNCSMILGLVKAKK